MQFKRFIVFNISTIIQNYKVFSEVQNNLLTGISCLHEIYLEGVSPFLPSVLATRLRGQEAIEAIEIFVHVSGVKNAVSSPEDQLW